MPLWERTNVIQHASAEVRHHTVSKDAVGQTFNIAEHFDDAIHETLDPQAFDIRSKALGVYI